jgi:hypothetical protein
MDNSKINITINNYKEPQNAELIKSQVSANLYLRIDENPNVFDFMALNRLLNRLPKLLEDYRRCARMSSIGQDGDIYSDRYTFRTNNF